MAPKNICAVYKLLSLKKTGNDFVNRLIREMPDSDRWYWEIIENPNPSMFIWKYLSEENLLILESRDKTLEKDIELFMARGGKFLFRGENRFPRRIEKCLGIYAPQSFPI